MVWIAIASVVGILIVGFLHIRYIRKSKPVVVKPKPLPNTFGYNFNVEAYIEGQLEKIKLPMNWLWNISIKQRKLSRTSDYADVYLGYTPRMDKTIMTIRPVNILTGEKFKESVETDLNEISGYTHMYSKSAYPSIYKSEVNTKFTTLITACKSLAHSMTLVDGQNFTVVPKEMSE